MTCKIDGVPYNAVLNVNIEDSDFSRKKAIRYIEYFKKLVSSNLIGAVIYIFPNGDVLQYCGGKDYFRLEYVKILGSTPNIRLIRMHGQKNISEEYSYKYCDKYYIEPVSDMIPSSDLYRILRYAITADSTEYHSFLDNLCTRFDLYTEYAFMTQNGFCKISAEN